MSSKNQNVKYLLCVINNFIKYAWVKAALCDFIETINESNRHSNKLWVDQGREFYNKLMQEWLGNSDTIMYSTHNEDKSVIAERLIITLKFQIYSRNDR